MDILIQGGRITKINKHEPKSEPSDSISIIDGTGKYLVPAYADAHGHLPDSNFVDTYMLMQLL